MFDALELSVVPLAYVEVHPLAAEEAVSLVGANVKVELLKITAKASLGHKDGRKLHIKWLNLSGETSEDDILRGSLFLTSRTVKDNENQYSNQFFNFQQSRFHATIGNRNPCHCIGYTRRNMIIQPISTITRVAVTEATLVRIVPPSLHSSWQDQLTGESPEPRQTEEQRSLILKCQNEETVDQLTHRMKMQLSNKVLVSTTQDAFMLQDYAQNRRKMFRSVSGKKNNSFSVKSESQHPTFTASTMFREYALIVHSPQNGAGKTTLVRTIGEMYCDSVHIIRPGALLAKFGIHADAALETIFHEIAISAAIKQESVCIILDQLDCLMPPNLSGRSGAGDAVTPVLNGTASYLKSLTLNMKRVGRIPFPSKNPLYNVQGKNGHVFPVKMCIVAVITCPDDGWRSSLPQDGQGSSALTTSIFDWLVAGRYRLPSLVAKTRFEGFRYALRREGFHIPSHMEEKLFIMAASAVWARGAAFLRVASTLREAMGPQTDTFSLDALTKAFAVGRPMQGANCNVDFVSNDSRLDIFGAVGGNDEAKAALIDALMFDEARRELLSSVGVSPPNGVLLYGPPGTGKTLLAKAVAGYLGALNNIGVSGGGAFVSLSSIDIVRGEVGTGEKLVVSAFESARLNAPSVIFIDEFQALFTDREMGGSSRLTTTLLQCLDDINTWKDVQSTLQPKKAPRIVVLAATNTPWMIDSAFLRSGRFDRSVHVPLPSDSDRTSILRLHVSRMKTAWTDGDLNNLCNNLASQTDGFSGADLAALCRAAAINCLLRESEFLECEDFKAVIGLVVNASSDKELLRRINGWRPRS